MGSASKPLKPEPNTKPRLNTAPRKPIANACVVSSLYSEMTAFTVGTIPLKKPTKNRNIIATMTDVEKPNPKVTDANNRPDITSTILRPNLSVSQPQINEPSTLPMNWKLAISPE